MTTTTNTSTTDRMDMGINCLLKNLGAIETERFISVLLREKSDYTKWRQRYFADVTSDEFHEAAVAYAKANPL